MTGQLSDLVVLVADKNMEAAVTGLLSRYEALKIRPLEFDVLVHVERDPGCFREGHNFLRPFVDMYQHGLVMFDRQGSGQESRGREKLESEVEDRLARSGWGDRAKVIVLDPELEVWVWSDSPEVDLCLGWERIPSLRQWLQECQPTIAPSAQSKPSDPKAAMEAALREVRKPRSSSIYRNLAESVSFQRCTDPAFDKLKTTLANWFAKSDMQEFG